MFPKRLVIDGETSVHDGTASNKDAQFCVAEKPKFIKHVLEHKMIEGLAQVISVNVNNCVVVLNVHILLYDDI